MVLKLIAGKVTKKKQTLAIFWVIVIQCKQTLVLMLVLIKQKHQFVL